ncbi:MAG: hypothetical protein B6226_05275 [Candidatus Cloacimonetes bacterium 4572_65]|nr:MAG: hypothetical protein B6226_05275 [Candidatus Cloacimonetes bacterium 4572_65]
MRYRWLFQESEESFINQILNKRGIDKSVYSSKLEDIPQENLLADMDKASDRVISALYGNEKIVIFGHDDPDGVTATYLIFDFLEKCGFQNHYYYIPNRLVDHHGIQDNLVEFLKETGAKLLITVDNGISSKEKIDIITELGIDVIVTDHHLFQQKNIPQCYAVVNPKREDCTYPYTMLAGVGVSLMLVRAIAAKINKEVKASYYFWCAVGSIADRVPMTGVNWTLVRHVLDNWDDMVDDTIIFLKSVCNPIITTYDKINFLNYCYRLIANGRANEGIHHGLRFLITEGREKYTEFGIIQTEKKGMEKKISHLNVIIAEIMKANDNSGVVYFDEEDRIPYPLLGTCATFLVNNLHEPVVMLKPKGDTILCEARCSDGFSVLEAFAHCESALIQYGGHVRAGGFTMKPENLELFIKLYKEYFQLKKSVIRENQFLEADATLKVSDINKDIWNDLDFMLPFGQENSEPVIMIKGFNAAKVDKTINIEYNQHKLKSSVTYDLMVQICHNGSMKVLDIKGE